jgi:hypothetical protein
LRLFYCKIGRKHKSDKINYFDQIRTGGKHFQRTNTRENRRDHHSKKKIQHDPQGRAFYSIGKQDCKPRAEVKPTKKQINQSAIQCPDNQKQVIKASDPPSQNHKATDDKRGHES